MISEDPLMHRMPTRLRPDPARVVARLFVPGEELRAGRSRAGAVVDRVLALPDAEVERIATQLVHDFAPRHRNYADVLAANASVVGAHLDSAMSRPRALVLGATFTSEFAVEAAALCNPSAVLHPDQRAIGPGQARVALSLRGIGEGHLSSIGFMTAVVGPGPSWRADARARPLVAGVSSPGRWRREHLRAVLADQGHFDEVTYSVLDNLPDAFDGPALQDALDAVHPDMLSRAGVAETVALLRLLVASAYEVTFPDDVELSQQVLLPSTAEESNGMEDARFVRFVAPDGAVDYRATYTAYDGRTIAPRLLLSSDLRHFTAHRLAGPAARNKGMAMFPRLIRGRHWALGRSDGENTFVSTSSDGLIWGTPRLIQEPVASWEVLQVGNCGPPIETERGWLVLTHGVGPMRTYVISAILLDLDDPARIVARLERPLLSGDDDERDGYVPNVLYSCGGLVHDGRLWLPYGIGDQQIGVAWADLDRLLDAMTVV